MEKNNLFFIFCSEAIRKCLKHVHRSHNKRKQHGQLGLNYYIFLSHLADLQTFQISGVISNFLKSLTNNSIWELQKFLKTAKLLKKRVQIYSLCTLWMRSRISWLLSKTQNWKMCRSISGRMGISQDEEFWKQKQNQSYST